MTVDLKQLRYFIAVAEERSFTRAAAKLHISQPPLSVRIKRLEREIGVPLLDRTTRYVALTEAGESLFGDARQLMMQLEQSIQQARRVGKGEVGHLTLGFVPSAASSILPSLLKNFRKSHPDISIALHELSPAVQVERLQTGRLDVAIFYLPSATQAPFGYSNLASQVLFEEPLVAMFPEGHPLTAARRIDLADLRGEPFVLVAAHRGPGLRDIILERCREAGFLPNGVQEATLIQTIGGLVASGVGVALVPASLRRLQPIGVDYRRLKGAQHMVRIGLIWRRDQFTPTTRTLLDAARNDVGLDLTDESF